MKMFIIGFLTCYVASIIIGIIADETKYDFFDEVWFWPINKVLVTIYKILKIY